MRSVLGTRNQRITIVIVYHCTDAICGPEGLHAQPTISTRQKKETDPWLFGCSVPKAPPPQTDPPRVLGLCHEPRNTTHLFVDRNGDLVLPEKNRRHKTENHQLWRSGFGGAATAHPPREREVVAGIVVVVSSSFVLDARTKSTQRVTGIEE